MSRSHVVTLLGLRTRLLVASVSGRSGRRVAAVIGLVAVAIWAASFGVTSFHMVRQIFEVAGDEVPGAGAALLRVIFLATFLLQLMTGVALLAVSDFFDTSRLLHLPVRARSIFLAMLISSVLSPSTAVFGAPAIGAVAALPPGGVPAALRFLPVLGLVTFGQASALFLGYVLLLALSRRRLRDLATVLGSVIGIGSYAALRFLGPGFDLHADTRTPLTEALDWVPTSWFADLVAWSDPERFRDAASLLLPSLALGASLVLGAWAFSRFYARAGESGQEDRSTRGAPPRSRLLPPAVGAVARQTLAVVWREPQLRALLFQQMIFLLIPLLSLRQQRGAPGALLSFPFFIIFSHAWMAMSLFGIDGPGLKLLLQSPANRLQILAGRAFAVWRLFAAIDVIACAVVVSALALMGARVDTFALLAQTATACVIADAVMIGAGAYLSVLSPSPIVRRSRSMRTRQEGCTTSLGKAVLRMPVILGAVVVGVAAVAPAMLPIERGWYFASVPAGVAVAAAICAAGIARASRLLAEREERLAAVLGDAGE